MPVIDSFIATSFNQDGRWSIRDCNVENTQDHNYLTKRIHLDNLKLSKEGFKLFLNSTFGFFYHLFRYEGI